MKLKLSSRDAKFYLLGILSMFLFATVYDWDENVKAFKKGYENGRSAWVIDSE